LQGGCGKRPSAQGILECFCALARACFNCTGLPDDFLSADFANFRELNSSKNSRQLAQFADHRFPPLLCTQMG
jgi:hypothetical protein